MSSVGGLHPSVARQALLVEDVKEIVSVDIHSHLSLTKKTQRKTKRRRRSVISRRKQSLTRFLGADCELFARKAAADLVVGVHTDAVDAGRVQLHNVRLIVGG